MFLLPGEFWGNSWESPQIPAFLQTPGCRSRNSCAGTPAGICRNINNHITKMTAVLLLFHQIVSSSFMRACMCLVKHRRGALRVLQRSMALATSVQPPIFWIFEREDPTMLWAVVQILRTEQGRILPLPEPIPAPLPRLNVTGIPEFLHQSSDSGAGIRNQEFPRNSSRNSKLSSPTCKTSRRGGHKAPPLRSSLPWSLPFHHLLPPSSCTGP